jgi:hypothetical protein
MWKILLQANYQSHGIKLCVCEININKKWFLEYNMTMMSEYGSNKIFSLAGNFFNRRGEAAKTRTYNKK